MSRVFEQTPTTCCSSKLELCAGLKEQDTGRGNTDTAPPPRHLSNDSGVRWATFHFVALTHFRPAAFFASSNAFIFSLWLRLPPSFGPDGAAWAAARADEPVGTAGGFLRL